jgi:hypothetical protein
MVVGAPDEEAITADLYPRSQVPVRLLPFLIERRYGFFGHSLVRAIGSQATDSYGMRSTDDCPATVNAVARPTGLRLSGRFERTRRPTWLVIVDGAGRIRGFVTRVRRTSEIAGYAPAAAPPGTLYGVQGDTLCFAALVPEVLSAALTARAPASVDKQNSAGSREIERITGS